MLLPLSLAMPIMSGTGMPTPGSPCSGSAMSPSEAELKSSKIPPSDTVT
ncbi:hypothetical protein A2U01_0076975, partial [Trifolium medium]|nr:hypothetical protein [Trifolium medium]